METVQLGFTISGFLRSIDHAISRAQLYALWKEGKGPQRTKLGGGRRILITRSDAEAWLRAHGSQPSLKND